MAFPINHLRFSSCATLLITLAFSSISSAQDASTLKRSAEEEVEKQRSLINEIADALWELSEISLKETRSARLLVEKLRGAEFQIEEGVAELPTAFVATYGQGSPVIGILAEYDALPSVGNQPVPQRRLRSDDVTSGHGCGHNLFAAASTGGAIALKAVMKENDLKGTLKVFGTPAEETLIGKVYMAKAGIFDGLDAVIDWHPGTKNRVRNQPGRAMNSFEVEFFGQAAHGAVDPWNGRSALDAVELMNYAVNMMREHVKPTARIHYVISEGGKAPNVVPEQAKVWYYVRDINRTEVEKYYKRILKIAEAAAMATETTHKVHFISGAHRYLLNRPLQEALQDSLELIGAPQFTTADEEFARSLQRYFKHEEKGLNSKAEPLPEEPGEATGGSTDAAEVSWIAPTAAFSVVTAPEGIPWHSWATTACHGTDAGRKGAIVAAKVIAVTGVRLFTEPALVDSARAFFRKATGGKSYQSPLPKGQKSVGSSQQASSQN